MSLLGAIEAGGTKFVLALARADGSIVERTRIDTGTAEKTRPAVADWFEQAAGRHGAIAGFGVASFGPIGIDPAGPDYGVFTNTPKPGWSGASMTASLARFAVPVAIDTDVTGAALGEWEAGAGRDAAVLAYTTVGTGIGSGVVKHGRPVTGISHFEAGHIRPVHDRAIDPFAGRCPFHGDCLEGLASGPAIFDRWGHDLSSADSTQIDLIAGYIADLAATLVLLHRPERMIFGGGVMKAAGMIERLRERTSEKLGGYIAEWDGPLDDRIVPPFLGDDAGLTGAIALARQAIAGEA